MTNWECNICFESIDQYHYITPCIHHFHSTCFEEWKKKCQNTITCPNCRTIIGKKKFQYSHIVVSGHIVGEIVEHFPR